MVIVFYLVTPETLCKSLYYTILTMRTGTLSQSPSKQNIPCSDPNINTCGLVFPPSLNKALPSSIHLWRTQSTGPVAAINTNKGSEWLSDYPGSASTLFFFHPQTPEVKKYCYRAIPQVPTHV